MKSEQSGRKLFLSMLLILCGIGSKVSAQVISTYAGINESGYNGEGIKATEAKLNGPAGGVCDNKGNVYVADYNGNRVRKIDNAGIITTIAGTGDAGFAADGSSAVAARINHPAGIVVDAQGNIYFSETGNNCIRKIDSKGILTTVAGTGTGGFSGDNGLAVKAELQGPGALAMDKAGNLYIADGDNNCIRKVSPSGIISRYAGNAFAHGTGTGSFGGDGGKATLAMLSQPTGIAIDAAGNLFIADCFNNRIRKVSAQGIITTVAGTGETGFGGDNGNAQKAILKYPGALAADAAGNIYIADNGNFRIRILQPDGNIATVAGNGAAGAEGDGGIAINAEIGKPSFITINNSGDIYFGNNLMGRIRKITKEEVHVITNIPAPYSTPAHLSSGHASGLSAAGSLQ